MQTLDDLTYYKKRKKNLILTGRKWNFQAKKLYKKFAGLITRDTKFKNKRRNKTLGISSLPDEGAVPATGVRPCCEANSRTDEKAEINLPKTATGLLFIMEKKRSPIQYRQNAIHECRMAEIWKIKAKEKNYQKMHMPNYG